MAPESQYRIGVDVGGTNTDSVIIDITKTNDPTSRGVVASFKHTTTPDVTLGIEAAVKKVLQESGIDAGSRDVLSLTIGTTHFVNAVVQSDSRRLSKVAVVRLGAPYSTECPSFIDFPKHLERIMNGHTAIIKGGFQMYRWQSINNLDEAEVIEQAHIIKDKGLKAVVVAGICKHEYRETVNIVCSRDVGQVGFLERENASILNASILSYAQRTIRGFKRAMRNLGLKCPLYLTQNDGTLITAAEAARLPIKTFSSGPTNSMRGASFLAGISLKKQDQASTIVVDIGGTTTDVGVLLPSGFPRQAAAFIEVAGVRTNFSMPDVHSIGLGGGSRIRAGNDGRVTVGPDSVGHLLTTDARVFGGDTLTATDIAVRSGAQVILGAETERSRVEYVSEPALTGALGTIQRLLEGVIDRMKTSPEDCDVLLVGGGSIVAPQRLGGVRKIITPPFHEVANAVGAAVASVSGEVDTIEILQGKSLSETLEGIKRQAIERAVGMGADVNTSRIAEVNVLPVQYVTNQATRIIVRAVGELGLGSGLGSEEIFDSVEDELEEDVHREEDVSFDEVEDKIKYSTYKPTIVNDEWILTETDLKFIMEGCGVLGTGGGGSPYPAYLIARQILRSGRSIRIVDYTSLPDDGHIVRGGYMGSPSIGSERLRGPPHLEMAGSELARYCGITKFHATLCDEIGGGNGMQSLIMSAQYNVPALDGDLMGRAVLIPCSLCDGDGNVVLLTRVKNEHFVESIMRVVTTEMGSSAALCPPPILVRDARDYGVTRSESQAWRIGRAISICRETNNIKGVAVAILELQNGVCLFVGKIIEISRDDELEEINTGPSIRYKFTEFSLRHSPSKLHTSAQIVGSVPDLIIVLDSQSGSHLGTPEYTYGLRVTVLCLAGHPLWGTPRGLEVGGPQAFELKHTYHPVGDYMEPRSVIEEYRIQ
ncbi:Hydantoinase/oxoprolinase [Cyathus striatus]|nr:Hydantoinase/oxoprolinase [Cyathus striatus]